MRHLRGRQQGMSLIEAMVALAVMASGTLAMLGAQASLRLSADLSRQQDAAVRIAQEALEATRGFDSVAAHDELVTRDPAPVAGYDTSNTSYRLQTLVAAAPPAGAEAPRHKTISVVVRWEDRSGTPRSVRLNSALHRAPPALGASLVVPADLSLLGTPGGRHNAIPQVAQMSGDGRTSSFAPPNSGGVRWTFDNLTGFITQTCATNQACTPLNARLLSGFVRFATEPGRAPDDQDARYPQGAALALEVVVAQTQPADLAGMTQCFEQFAASHVAYHCAVPVGAEGLWGGQSRVVLADIAQNLAEASAGRLRICRYTARLGHLTVPEEMANEEHPLDYRAVRGPLVNQNFLVIRAGDGRLAYDCPSGDNARGDPDPSARTYRHQPAA